MCCATIVVQIKQSASTTRRCVDVVNQAIWRNKCGDLIILWFRKGIHSGILVMGNPFLLLIPTWIDDVEEILREFPLQMQLRFFGPAKSVSVEGEWLV